MSRHKTLDGVTEEIDEVFEDPKIIELEKEKI